MKAIVGGAGEVGRHLASVLTAAGHAVVIVDSSPDALEAAEEDLDVRIMLGDLTSRHDLRKAGGADADAIIAVTGSDEANMLGAALGHDLGVGVAVARVDRPSFYEGELGAERGLLGIDHLLSGGRLAASEILALIAGSDAAMAHSFVAGAVQVALFRVTAGGPADGCFPDDLPVSGVTVGGIARGGFLRRAVGSARLEPSDGVLLAGPATAVAASLHRLQAHKPLRQVVVGGSEIGAIVAQALAHRSGRVELIEVDRGRCVSLSGQLEGVTILHGDATDLAFLQEVRFAEADRVIAVTQHEEVNLLTGLFMPHLGRDKKLAPVHSVVSVHRYGYAELCRSLGLQVVSTFEVLTRGIVEAIRPPGEVCRVSLGGLAWTIVHVRLPPRVSGSPVVEDLPLPPGAVVLAVARGGLVLEPEPRRPIRARDELVVVCPERDCDSLGRAIRDMGVE